MKNYDITEVPELYGVVYMLTNPLGERYIGSAVDLRDRMGRYRNGYGHGLIGESILKYGWENHQLSILAKNISDKNLRSREYKFIREIQPELNLITPNAGGLVRHAESTKQKISEANKGQKRTPEQCANISAAQKGKPKHTPEHRAKLSAASKGENNPNFGKKHSSEARAKISAVHKGKVVSSETRAKMSAAHKGKKHTPETRAKISAGNKGKKMSPETCAKNSAAQKGKTLSLETRAKISAAQKGIKLSPEVAAARREYWHRRNGKRDKKIIAMRKKNKSHRAIADCVGLSRSSVRRICQQHQIEIPERMLTTQQRKQRDKKIISMRKKGKSYQAIADCVGLSGARVRQICRRDAEISKALAAQQLRNQKRDKKIISMRKKNKSHRAIADCFGLSRARVQQICQQVNK